MRSSSEPCAFRSNGCVDLIGVLFADIASLISSSFFATDVAACLILLRPPCRISFDFRPVRLGLEVYYKSILICGKIEISECVSN